MRSPTLLALLLVTTMVAGCAASSGASLKDPGATAPAPTVSDDAGAIHGVVTDDSLNPVVKAQVLVRETGATAETDATGGFTINNLGPGSYTLLVGALGFDSDARKVEVVQGQVTSVKVILRSVAIVEAWSHPMIFPGYMQCTWRGPRGSGPCFFPDADLSEEVFTQNKRAFLYTVFPHMRTLVGELEWPTTSAATTNTMTLLLSYANRTTSHVFGSIEGASPVKQICERTADEWIGCNGGSQGLSEKREISEEKGLYMRHFVSTGRARVAGVSPVNYGITIEQPIKLYVTVFYGEPGPTEFSAIPDT